MRLRSGKLPFLGSEDEFFYHTTQHRILILPIHSLLFGEGGSDEAKQLKVLNSRRLRLTTRQRTGTPGWLLNATKLNLPVGSAHCQTCAVGGYGDRRACVWKVRRCGQ